MRTSRRCHEGKLIRSFSEGREHHFDGSAMSDGTTKRNSSMMEAHNFVHNGKAKAGGSGSNTPGTRRICTVEGLKDMVEIFLCNTNTGIDDSDRNTTILSSINLNGYLTFFVCRRVVNGILRQIGNDLFKGNCIAVYHTPFNIVTGQ